MVAPLLITLREGLEAALIIGIVLAYLARTGNGHRSAPIWAGTAAAILVSVIAGVAIFLTVGELEGAAEQIFEGTAMLLAVAMLTYMVIWMKRQSSSIRGELQGKVQAALRSGSGMALATMAFVVVVREGIETALFFFASSRTSTGMESLLGGIAGLALATALGYAVYRGSHRLSLGTFFNATGILLIVFAAGLLAHGIHEFEEAGVVPILIEHVWDVNWLLNEKSDLGRFLTALVGYNGNPSLLEVAGYVSYLAISLNRYLSPAARAETPIREDRQVA